jgi:hypothetical protein
VAKPNARTRTSALIISSAPTPCDRCPTMQYLETTFFGSISPRPCRPVRGIALAGRFLSSRPLFIEAKKNCGTEAGVTEVARSRPAVWLWRLGAAAYRKILSVSAHHCGASEKPLQQARGSGAAFDQLVRAPFRVAPMPHSERRPPPRGIDAGVHSVSSSKINTPLKRLNFFSRGRVLRRGK